MKIVALAAFAAVSIAVPGSSSANTGGAAIVVAAPTVAQWSTKVGTGLQRNMQSLMRSAQRTGPLPSGLVAVQFICSENGRPMAIELSYKAGNAEMNSLARSAVAGLRDLHPLAAGIGDKQVYEAVISQGSDSFQLDDQMVHYRQAQASTAHRANVLALVVTSNLAARPS